MSIQVGANEGKDIGAEVRKEHRSEWQNEPPRSVTKALLRTTKRTRLKFYVASRSASGIEKSHVNALFPKFLPTAPAHLSFYHITPSGRDTVFLQDGRGRPRGKGDRRIIPFFRQRHTLRWNPREEEILPWGRLLVFLALRLTTFRTSSKIPFVCKLGLPLLTRNLIRTINTSIRHSFPWLWWKRQPKRTNTTNEHRF